MSTDIRLVAAILVLAPCAGALAADECAYEAERSAVVDAGGADRLVVLARAGELEVRGRPGLSEVRVTARACASAEDLLDGIRLTAERRDDGVHVEAVIPEWGGFSFRSRYARLDLVIEVPAGIAADISDSSGSIELSALGGLTLDDSSDSIRMRSIAGPARVRDSSGEIDIDDVAGMLQIADSSGSIRVARAGDAVRINDSSGEIDVRGVAGSVELTDSSGSIHVGDATGDVTVHSDSSGSIRVENVGGNFTVRRDSSGGVSYRNVGGAVDVPRD